MAKLRHIAMSVPHDDVRKTADFYVDVFGMRRIRAGQYTEVLTDETVGLVILSDKLVLNLGHRGLHHIGFIVDDLEAMQKRVVESGVAELIPDEVTATVNEQVHGTKPLMGKGHEDEMEHKISDPNGLTVDMVTLGYAQGNWKLPGT